MPADIAYDRLLETLRETSELESCSSLLDWDMETYMPPAGLAHRARQQALLAGLVHERHTSPELEDLICEANAEGPGAEQGSAAAANVREARRDFERRTKLSVELVKELAETTALARAAWKEAREKKEYALFRPWLDKLLDLNRRKAEALGYEESAYDALMDEHEPGETARGVTALFHPLREALADLLGRILDADDRPDGSILTRNYPVETQARACREMAAAIGFDFNRGRIDVTTHPFCNTIGPGDTRITTRYNDRFFSEAYFGTMHEAGHGIYEQGLARDSYGAAMSRAASTAIHESQSRLWENFVGRSRGFWKHRYPSVQAAFPEALGGVEMEAFYRAINEVTPSFIRVEADEVTYNLHIFLRFELEKALLSGDLSTGDLPQAWNDAFARDFRMTPPDDAMGCLQDIHWSMGAFGYFPTYSLGNVYAAQFLEKARGALEDLDAQLARGEFSPLREWLQVNLYRHGQRYDARELVERVTGRPPSVEPLIRHLETKYGEVYGL